jgi:transposase InsO family protein
MTTKSGLSLPEMDGLVQASEGVDFRCQGRAEMYGWVEATLVHWEYHSQGKKQKGTIRSYIRKMTGLSMPQVTRLIRLHRGTGCVKTSRKRRRRFPSKYTVADFALLAKVDEAHQRLNGPATRRILEREWEVFGKKEFERLSGISVSHLYNMRRSEGYGKHAIYLAPTRPVQIAIGERRLPDPRGQPGYLRVDTVHQGDQDGKKGVYHINAVDTVTQWEVVGCVSQISEQFLIPVLEAILHQFPFRILGFHTDNGSEYVNREVCRLLEKLRVEFTKSRAYRTQDNALVEGKNGAVIRKHMGNQHIGGEHAEAIQKYYTAHFNPYLNYHRPCGFATVTVNAKGKQKREYRTEDYATPYEKLKQIAQAEQYLKAGVTWEKLDCKANSASDTEFAQRIMKAKSELLRSCRDRQAPLPPRW